MAVFSPTNAKVHFKAYDGNFTDALGNTAITQNNGVAMATAQKLFGQQAMFMANFSDSITFNTPSVFDVGTGDYTVGFWFHPTQLTSYDRLFATGPDSGGNPFRIYNHNGSIGIYVENDDEVPSDANHDLIINYYLGAGAANQWWHIMVQRNSGTTKLYINGTEQGSSTVSYEIDNSSSPTLGADINAAATGVKGYIQDFFWTEEAVSFSQADFDPSTPEPVTFHSGNPSISSFSSSANSVENSGDTVTLSWSVSGETKLELLKYVGGLLNSTEDVLGLSSKSVTITETVSYKIRATNDNSAVDSSSVQITLGGGNSMAGTMLSGSDAIPYQLHAGVLGGFVSGSSAGQFQAIPVEGLSATTADRVAGVALHSSFANSSGSIISALNFLQSEGDFTAGQGVNSSALSSDVISLSASHQSFQFDVSGGTGKLELSGNVAGDGLALSAGSLSVNVDDSSIETDSDTLRVKALGITNAMLAGSIANGKLANSTISGVSLGSNLNSLNATSKGGIAVSSYNGSAAVSDLALDIDGMDEIGAALVAADTFAVDDGNDGTNRKATVERIGDFVGSGADFDVADGVLSLADNSVGVAELATAVAGDGLSGGGGSALAVQVSGSVVIASDKVGLSGSIAGDGLAYVGGVNSISGLKVNVDDSSIETDSDTLRVKASGITNAMLAGSIANGKLANSTISGVSLGSNLNSLNATSKGGIAVSSYNGSAAVSDLALDIDGMDEIGAALVAADTFAVDDGNDGTNRKATVERIGDFVGSGADFNVSSGALSIAASRVGKTEIVALGVGTAELQADAVNSAKILDASITSDKLAASIHRTAAGENIVFDANGVSATGLFLQGTDSSGTTARFQVVVQGGMLQLKTGMALPSESGGTSAAADGADAA